VRAGGEATLADLEACGCRRLEIACERCSRHGVYVVARLVERYGGGMSLRTLCRRLTTDCPGRHLGQAAAACSAHFLQLDNLLAPAFDPAWRQSEPPGPGTRDDRPRDAVPDATRK
jgi:hypothetical protein